MRVAAIDCGTNSIRLLVAEQGEHGLRDVQRRMEIVRLGQGVDETNKFDPTALERTFAAAKEYAALINHYGVQRVGFVATSATRDATNRDVFLDGIQDILGVRPRVITGQQEAELTFRGAARVVPVDSGPTLVVDLGGGSTEFILGSPGASPTLVSLDIGSVRVTERFFPSGCPTPKERAKAQSHIDQALAQAGQQIPFDQVATMVGTAGTITTVTAHALGLTRYDSTRINGARIGVEDLIEASVDLVGRTRWEKEELGFLHPQRVDVIGAGSLIWASILQTVSDQVSQTGNHLGEVITSEHDILDGLALDLLGEPGSHTLGG